MVRSNRQSWGRARNRGLTLIEVVIGMAIAALAASIAVGAINSLTSSALRSTAVELTGAVKTAYDRAVMLRRTERLSIDLDKGLWWIDYTEDPYALSSERTEGKEGEKDSKDDDKDDDKRRSGKGKSKKGEAESKSIFSDSGSNDPEQEARDEVKRVIEGGRAIDFVPDKDALAKPRPFPSDIKASQIWAGHQAEAFKSGIARIHFFSGGWCEPAIIELSDGSDFVTLKVYPLTGRVRSYNKQLETPKSDHEDGKEDDRE